jgi:hypothetical protein
MQGGKGSCLIHRGAGLQRQSNKERMSEWWQAQGLGEAAGAQGDMYNMRLGAQGRVVETQLKNRLEPGGHPTGVV